MDRYEAQLQITGGLRFLQSQLFEYSAWSIVATALQVLSESKPRSLEDIQTFPWITLLLAKWAVQDPRCRMYASADITRAEFDQFRQRLWDMTGPAKQNAENAYSMLRSILPSQIEFQRRAPWAFMRWPSLLARLPADHESRRQFEQAVGLTPEDFIDACWIITPPVAEGKRTISSDWVEAVPASRRHAVDRLLHLLGSDFLGLRERMSSLAVGKYDAHWWELFEIPFARRLPLYQMSNGSWRVWHPSMYERALEDAAHLVLTPLGEAYTQSFSPVFEEHVVELAARMCPGLVSEEAWWAKMGRRSPAVEAIFPLGEVSVFVEVKMSLFHDVVLTEDAPSKLESRLERVLDAARQGQRVSALLRERPREFPRRAEAKEEYLLIVTSREVYVGGGRALQRLLPEVNVPIDDSISQRMPLENIFVMSVESFERLCGVGVEDGVDLVGLLREAASANRDPARAAMLFDDHLKRHHKGAWFLSPLIVEQSEAAKKRIKEAFEAE